MAVPERLSKRQREREREREKERERERGRESEGGREGPVQGLAGKIRQYPPHVPVLQLERCNAAERQISRITIFLHPGCFPLGRPAVGVRAARSCSEAEAPSSKGDMPRGSRFLLGRNLKPHDGLEVCPASLHSCLAMISGPGSSNLTTVPNQAFP